MKEVDRSWDMDSEDTYSVNGKKITVRGEKVTVPNEFAEAIEASKVSYAKRILETAGIIVNAKEYGAVGDGDTDDSEAITKAFNYAVEKGAVLYIPEGEYAMKWGCLLPFISENGVTIIGDGKFKSIIKFNEDHLNSEGVHAGNGMVIQHTYTATTKPNVLISGIGLYYDNDTSALVPTKQASLLRLYGQYGKVCIEDCYFHLGGIAENKPADSCVFISLGADVVTFKNNIVENYTNNIHGAGLWIMPDYKDWREVYHHYTVDSVVVSGNVFKTSNGDEAVSLYPSTSNKTPTGCFNHIFIDSNVFIHKNWIDESADCFPTYGLITIFNENASAPVLNLDAVVSNNTIDVSSAFQDVIRFEKVAGVDLANNHIIVHKAIIPEPEDENEPRQTFIRTIQFTDHATGIVRNNYIDYTNLTTHEARITVGTSSEVTWKDNIIATGQNLGANVGNNGVLVFERNTAFVPSGYNFVPRKASSSATVLVYDNTIYGTAGISYLSDAGFFIKNNRFNANTGIPNDITPSVDTNVETAELEYEMNDGATLTFTSSLIKHSLASFKYVGLKRGLRFKVGNAYVEDSPAVRATFFDSCDITYIDEKELPTAPIADGDYTLKVTVAEGAPTYSWEANE